MINFRLLIFVLLINRIISNMFSQNNATVTITSSFNSECIVTGFLEKDEIALLESMNLYDCIAACKENDVNYYAECNHALSYSWSVAGAVGYNVIEQGSGIRVTWGTGDWGIVSVSVMTSDSCIHEAEQCIILIDPPVVSSISIPENALNEDGYKTITICRGSTLYFTDSSSSIGAPIVGHYWDTPYGTASTPNFSITCTQPQDFKIEHTVINACGCTSMEIYQILIAEDGNSFELSCYGTVCGGQTASYSSVNNNCDPFIWLVEGGNVVEQNDDSITVQWNFPEIGYGVISLDGTNCDSLCNQLFSIKIPVISEGVTIEGPENVCLDNTNLYELPLWGSTLYEWEITPDSGYELYLSEHDNAIYLKFLQEGSFQIIATYYCDFLNCGTFTSQTKSITVKPVLEIESEHAHVCEGDTGLYYVNATNAEWIVYQNTTALDTLIGNSLSYQFDTAGIYRIYVSHPDFCNGPGFTITVHTPPPPVENVTGDTVSCSFSGILLQAEPTSPQYFLEWVPVCTSASPHLVQGSEVTIKFDTLVCDIAVCQIDGVYGCRSQEYIHPVEIFQPIATGFPALYDVCAGSSFSWSINDPSPNVLYTWTIDSSSYASIQGSNRTSDVSIFVNHINNDTVPYTFKVFLKRKFCNNTARIDIMQVRVFPTPLPTISFNSEVCTGDSITFTATGSFSNNSHYHWNINGITHSGRIVKHLFTESGSFPITLTYSHDTCTPVSVYSSIYVIRSPAAFLYYNYSTQTACVTHQPHCTYQWYYNNILQNDETDYCFQNSDTGTYCCIVTDTITDCENMGCCNIYTDTSGSLCYIVPSSSVVDCNTFTTILNAPSFLSDFEWSLNTDMANIIFSNDTLAQVQFNGVGSYVISATAYHNGQCFAAKDTININVFPDFDLTYDCTNHTINIHDNSQFIGNIPSRSFNVNPSSSYPITMTSTQTEASFSVNPPYINTSTIIVSLTLNGCTKRKSITIYPTINQLNPNNLTIPSLLCANTPFEITAPIGFVNYRWDFGDNSFCWGREIHHTYGSIGLKTITLYVTNENQCTNTFSKTVNILNNSLENNNLTTSPIAPICPSEEKNISYSNVNPSNFYTWFPDNITNHSFQHTVSSTNDYKVHVVDVVGCVDEDMVNVPFLNTPTAKISGETVFCQNENVSLLGNSGDFVYEWQIITPQDSTTLYTTPNISFTPTQSGWFTAILTVSNADCDSYDTLRFYVNPKPAAPNVVFGSNSCIHNPPVILRTSDNRTVYWNVGTFANTAYYYYAGYATAYFVDTTTGCPSATQNFCIPPAPDYDALLTGCYQKCEDFFSDTNHLQLYRYIAYPASWTWNYQDDEIDNGTGIGALLPLPNHGTYYMTTYYNNDCRVFSPELIIDSISNCTCEDIEVIFWKPGNIQNDSCRIHNSYVTILIKNHRSTSVTFHTINNHNPVLFDITSSSVFPITLLPNSNSFFQFSFSLSDCSMSAVELYLYDSINNCEINFSIPIDLNNRFDDYCNTSLYDIRCRTTGTAPDFNFQISLPSNTQEVISVWCDPPQVQSYYITNQNRINGEVFFNATLLSQMAAANENVCFYVALCINDSTLFCLDTLCVSAESLIEMMLEERGWMMLQDSIKTPNDFPYLVPNPATHTVTVHGCDFDIKSLQLFDITGKMILSTKNQNWMSLQSLNSGIYIIRVTTKKNTIYHLKLVKQ